MKKCVSIYKLHTILKVAPSKKIRCLCEKTLSIQARFSVKNRAKIGPESDSKWQRQRKTTKIASGAVSGRTFSAQEPFLVDFGLPAGTRKSPKNRPWPQSSVYFLCLQLAFLRFLRSGAFRKGPGPIPEAPGSLPDQILQRFCDVFWPVSPGSCRGLSGSAGRLPGYTASLRNSLCGVSLGYGDLAERIKFWNSEFWQE